MIGARGENRAARAAWGSRRREGTPRSGPSCLSILSWLPILAVVVVMAGSAEAHEGAVGVVQAKVGPGGQVLVLLKFKVESLVEAALPGGSGGVDALTTPEGRGAVLDLLVRTHSVEVPGGLCERDSVDRFEPAPSRVWFDIILKYRCPDDWEKITVRVETLLVESGHRLMGTFEQEGVVTRSVLTRRSPRFVFKASGSQTAQVQPAAAPPQESPQVRSRWSHLLDHAEFFLLPLILLGGAVERRRAAAAAAASVVMALGLGLTADLGATPPTAEVIGLVGLLGVAALIVRHLLLEHPIDGFSAGMVVLVAACVGLGMARDGGLALEGSAALGGAVRGGLVGLSALVGLALGRWGTDRGRRVVAFAALGGIFSLAVGEIARIL